MGGTNAKPIRVAVLAHDGTLLGYVNRRPHNANWRMLGKRPRVSVVKGVVRSCDREWVYCGRERVWFWIVRLTRYDNPPADMEAP